MIPRREAAQRLDIPVEMAVRHGLPAKLSEEEFVALEQDPPPWLVQSRENRTGRRPVWVTLVCVVCGRSEAARPKKWWPDFTFLACEDHPAGAWPPHPEGHRRDEYDGIGTRFVGVVDTPA
ncbi:hypothetical protein [Rathayibacter iranicus]|uniref:Uncharacterized protein n=2 Tax=Rathayibacter iranicus TaxID=59737 RepID=A0AAD1AF65_9MICO|nr:hypothetical protein [Rathayibacter iranicus]AZZ56005.1 hypothetical protein C7V51_09035 [Rathayibacter iranicus]MWV30310.1 hypothetical protein [Rathayibacter iranicus NCPPB 2253 = VKM Ac-1602]PPI46467.1 hypothetical protein C5E09_08025 [Rathayibacter iranicus]PPI59882.1 hypothetical protein C5E08_08955 [Rathayibacter iranicus]PPI71546.1 hypothetical protein C5E01_07990 [Rathayibacter iranicus]